MSNYTAAARKDSSTVIVSPTGLSFPPTSFQDLPLELRFKVYNMTLPGPRTVPLTFRGDTCDNGRKHQAISNAPVPIVLHICRESREECLKSYHITFGINGHPARIPFNFNIDTLYMPSRPPEERDICNLEYFFDRWKRGKDEEVQHFAFGEREITRNFLPFHDPFFRRIRTLTYMIDSAIDKRDQWGFNDFDHMLCFMSDEKVLSVRKAGNSALFRAKIQVGFPRRMPLCDSEVCRSEISWERHRSNDDYPKPIAHGRN